MCVYNCLTLLHTRNEKNIVNQLSAVLSRFRHVRFFANPMDCSPPGFSVHGILSARILEWVAISFFQGISLTQGSNLHLSCLSHWQAGSLSLVPSGKPTSVYVCVCVYTHVYIICEVNLHIYSFDPLHMFCRFSYSNTYLFPPTTFVILLSNILYFNMP